jgi:predicted nucleotidyltransferase
LRNAHPAVTPHEAYDEEASQRAVECAKRVVEYAKEVVLGRTDRVVGVLVEKFRPVVIMPFGLGARGGFEPRSGYDPLIVADFEKPYLERLGEVIEAASGSILPIEPHPHTLGEVLEMLDRGNPLVVDAPSKGEALYETSEFREVREKYRRLVERGLRKTETSAVLPRE